MKISLSFVAFVPVSLHCEPIVMLCLGLNMCLCIISLPIPLPPSWSRCLVALHTQTLYRARLAVYSLSSIIHNNWILYFRLLHTSTTFRDDEV